MKILEYNTANTILSKLNLSPVFTLEEIIESKIYNTVIFSVFDHWLTEDEADKNIILYDKNLFSKQPKEYNKYRQYEKNFIHFYNDLYQKYLLYAVLQDSNGKALICKFDTKNECLKLVKSSIREEQVFLFLVPELQCVFSTNYDFTHILYVNKKYYSAFEKSNIFSMVNENNLFILT